VFAALKGGDFPYRRRRSTPALSILRAPLMSRLGNAARLAILTVPRDPVVGDREQLLCSAQSITASERRQWSALSNTQGERQERARARHDIRYSPSACCMIRQLEE
jgi:hypothetical protein